MHECNFSIYIYMTHLFCISNSRMMISFAITDGLFLTATVKPNWNKENSETKQTEKEDCHYNYYHGVERDHKCNMVGCLLDT